MPLIATAQANAAIAVVLVPGTTYYATTHTASPGATGANEGATPTRGAIVLSAASGGTESNTATVTMTNSGTVAQTHVGVFDAATGTAYRIGAQLGQAVTAGTIVAAAGALQWTAS